MSPPSPTTIVFSSTKEAISAQRRNGWIGLRSLVIHSSICARVLSSFSRSSSSHGWWSQLRARELGGDRLEEGFRASDSIGMSTSRLRPSSIGSVSTWMIVASGLKRLP